MLLDLLRSGNWVAAVCVDGEDKVKTDLIIGICSNFFTVDPRGFVQLAHLSVREYLEVKEVDGKLIYSPEETHAAAAYTCLLYFKNVARLVAEQREYDVDVEEVEASDEDEGEESDVDDDVGKEGEDANATKSQYDAQKAASSPFIKEGEDANAPKSPYDAPNADYFDLADEYLMTDLAPKLEPREAIKRFQRYASIYWATHCEAAKKFRTESSTLNELFWEFLEDDGENPAFQQWTTALFNESKLASLPTIDPAPMIFIPTTAHRQHILDAEPMYTRWAEIITHVGGLQPLKPSVSLMACSYGFIDVLQEISEDGSALVTCNHQGIPGIVLATRNGFNEVLDLPIPLDLDLDVPDKDGRTPLHHAAFNGSLDLARILLGYPRQASRRQSKKGRQLRADVNAKDLCHRTPLHIAAEYGQLEVLKLLLQEEKLDVHVKNDYGYTALGMCATKPGLASLLRADTRYKVEDEFECDGVEDGYSKNIMTRYRMDKKPWESDEKPEEAEGPPEAITWGPHEEVREEGEDN